MKIFKIPNKNNFLEQVKKMLPLIIDSISKKHARYYVQIKHY